MRILIENLIFPGSSAVEQLAVYTGIANHLRYDLSMDKRTYADRREYLKSAVSKRRKALRIMAVKYKGGKCSVCGYEKCIDALDFHHIKGKDFGLSADGMARSWTKTKQELEKCILVCANCHREIHSKSQPQEEILE